MPLTSHKQTISVDMLRAFVSLSETLNLTETSDALSLTRQTVRRHINDLERIKGAKLFTLKKHQYMLTQAAEDSLAEARNILRQVDLWSGRRGLTKRSLDWLEHARFTDQSGRVFYSQQHPLSSISGGGLPIMRAALSAWGQSLTQIEDPAMKKIRPFLVVYRKYPKGWICTEIGEQSAYARWFGWAWSKSAIGRLSEDDNAGEDINDFIAGAYARIYGEGGVRLDHLFAHLPREGSDDPVPVSFQRLLMGCVFPDETPALAVLVLMTNQIQIDALPDGNPMVVDDDLTMDFDI